MLRKVTPNKYTFLTPEDQGQEEYDAFCAEDIAYQGMLVEGNASPGLFEGLEVDPAIYPKMRDDWPTEWRRG